MEGRSISQNHTITLLYTANLAGDLALLPRLMTIINRARQTAAGPVFLIDLGDTCAVDVWICRATEGRAPFLVLDAMGYDAVVIGGPEQVPIPIPSLRKLTGSISLSLIVWNRAVQLTKRGITITVAAGRAELPAEQTGIRFDRSQQTPLPQLGDTLTVLGDAAKGDLARVDVMWPSRTVAAAQVISVMPDTPRDPTTAAIIDLVEREAKQYVQQSPGGDT